MGAPSFSVIVNASAYASCEFARLPPIMNINAAGKRREEMVVIGRRHKARPRCVCVLCPCQLQ